MQEQLKAVSDAYGLLPNFWEAVEMGPVEFSIFINDLDNMTECTLSKFAKDTKILREVAGTPDGYNDIQRDWGRLEK